MQSLLGTIKQVGLVTVALTLALAANFAYGQWVNPTAAPTGGNVAAPINTSGVYQEKYGNIGLGQLIAADKVRSFQYCDLTGLVCLSEADIQSLKNLIAGGGGSAPDLTGQYSCPARTTAQRRDNGEYTDCENECFGQTQSGSTCTYSASRQYPDSSNTFCLPATELACAPLWQ